MNDEDLGALYARAGNAMQSAAADFDRLLSNALLWKALAEKAQDDRDSARQYADSCVCGAWMNPAGLTVWAERDNLAAENARLRQGNATLQRDLDIALAGCEHMRSVVEAAEAWRAEWTAQWMKALYVREPDRSRCVECGCETFPPGVIRFCPECDGRMELAYGEDLPEREDSLPGRGGGKAGDGDVRVPAGAEGTDPGVSLPVVSRLASDVPTLTADPPGLDAAIEAAAYELDWIERVNVEAAVRAAAPALRAGALREAADEWEAKGWTGFARLRARADRIGGAT